MKTYRGYRPFQYQWKVHKALDVAYRSEKTYVVKAKRQVGKSAMAENELLRFAINYAGSQNGIIEPTLNQSRRVFRDILKSIEDSDILKRKNETLLELEFVNGSIIYFKSGEQLDGLRGMTITGILILDEAAYLSDEVLDILRPTVDAHKAPILMISTPRYKNGFFYDYFMKGLVPAKYYESFDWALEDTSRLLSPDKLEEYRQTVSKNKFTTEYLGEFLDENGQLFTNIKECIGEPEAYQNLYIGIDWATGAGEDYTVVTGLNERGEMVFMECFNDKTPTEQIELISGIFRRYGPKIKTVQVEKNSIGAVFYDMLKKQNPKITIHTFVTTNESKGKLVNKLQIALEQKKIRLLKNDKLLNELRLYEGDYNPKTGKTSYNAPSGFHDDTVIALMLAYDSINKGQYNIKVK